MPSNLTFAEQAPGAVGYQQNHPAAAHLPILDQAGGRVDLFAGGRKKIRICGFASSSRALIPFDNPDWILGGMNQLYRHGPRFDYWFDIHANWTDGNVAGTDHRGWLQTCGIPVFMVEPPDDLPTALPYPRQTIVDHFGIDYNTSSVSYMLAWAIFEIKQAVARRLAETPLDVSLDGNGTVAQSAADFAALTTSIYGEYTIGIFGIDLIVGDEYDFQKSCAEFWIAQADALGIHVYIPPQSALCKQRWAYGFQSEPDGGLLKMSDYQARQADLKSRMAKLNEQHNRVIAEMQAVDGALQEVTHHLTVMDLRMKGGEIPLAASED